MSASAAYASPAPPQSASARLSDGLGAIAGAIDQLEERLGQVLSPLSQPTMPGPDSPPQSPVAHLADVAWQLHTRLEALMQRIEV